MGSTEGGGMGINGPGTYDTWMDDSGPDDMGTYGFGSDDMGMYDSGLDDMGMYDSGRYDTGMYEPGTYGTEMYESGRYDTGMYESGTYSTEMYESGRYGTGMDGWTGGMGLDDTAMHPHNIGHDFHVEALKTLFETAAKIDVLVTLAANTAPNALAYHIAEHHRN